MKLFDPTSAPVDRAIALAPRLSDLRGLRVGLVENTKFNSDTLLFRLADRFGAKYGTSVALVSRKRSPSHSIEDAQIQALKRVSDLVISGVGD